MSFFWVDNSSSVHVDNKKNDISVLGESPTWVSDDITISAEGKYSISFAESRKRFVFSLHCNGSSSFLYGDATIICQFKTKDSKIKPYPWCLSNISKDITIDNMKKTGLRGAIELFLFDYNAIDTNNILDINRYLMKETWYIMMFGIITKMFIGLLTSAGNASNHTKYASLNNRQCMIQPALIDFIFMNTTKD